MQCKLYRSSFSRVPDAGFATAVCSREGSMETKFCQ
ncbi:Os02g0182950 [Oryza sativa Japonica Group]|uniref:Os02g0182950 protein n=1 Tax=Oryza sativa subsp. japonica TaxID=39947 RepID=C7IYG1_ORYSJ|nr:Os02g0182950 [Oryza sativa Japonica Group]|eukprot:NP_001172831.1 Os02g0182950 [Oryza sativa Japonica Group]